MNSSHRIPQQHSQKSISVFGASLDVGNMGCRALAASLIGLLRRARPETRIHLLYGRPNSMCKTVRLDDAHEVTVHVVNHRLSLRSRLNEHLLWIVLLALIYRVIPWQRLRQAILRRNRFLRTLAQSEFVGDIRGGDSFSDIYGRRRLFFGSLPTIAALLIGCRVILLPQTIGPFQRRWARWLARWTLSRATLIYARDRESLDTARSLLDDEEQNRSVRLSPDVAFSLQPIEPKPWGIEPPLPADRQEPVMGLNVSGLLYMGGYTGNNMFNLQCDYKEMIDRLGDQLLEHTPARLLLIPHTFGSSAQTDAPACRQLWERLSARYPGRVHLAEGDYDQNEVKAVIGQCDFFMGSRMHACIGALSQNIPTVGLAYSRKFRGVFDSVGVADAVVDLRRVASAEEVLETCLNIYDKRSFWAERLKDRIALARRQLDQCFNQDIWNTERQTDRPAPQRLVDDTA